MDVGVGDGGLVIAKSVGCRAGMRAGALGADAKRTQFIDPRKAAAAGADLNHVDHRSLQRITVLESAHIIERIETHHAVLHQSGLGRGAAHVEGE